MTQTVFKRTLFVSLFWHLAIFTLFGFSFGKKLTPPNYAQIIFWGAILEGTDLMSSQNFKSHAGGEDIFLSRFNSTVLADITSKEYPLRINYYLRPLLAPEFKQDKLPFIPAPLLSSLTLQEKKRPQIMFYPHLPSHFLFYFKDRESVHIELIFNIVSNGRSSHYPIIKRKTSSGNLEADLLAMRYISHYLFIQQAVFPANKWQTVKIDLSKKND